MKRILLLSCLCTVLATPAWVQSAEILYCVDQVQGADAMSLAVNGFSGAANITETTVANCEASLGAQGWDIVILAIHNTAHAGVADFPNFAAYVTGEGRAILQDTTREPSLGALFDAGYTGSDNQTPVDILDAALAAGVTNPMALVDPGWPAWSTGMNTAGGVLGATMPNGDAAIVIGSSGYTIVNGFATDAPSPVADGVALYTNEILMLAATMECADDAACDDGDLCTGTETCVNHQCVPGTPPDCTDLNPCTDDFCQAYVGCQNPPNSNPCDDGDPCTLNDACAAGACAGVDKTTVPVASGGCDDLNPCTNDFCAAGTGACGYADNANSCDDGLWCTVNDGCSAGACVGMARDCSALDDSCNTGVCNESSGACEAQPVGDGTLCDDGLFCTVSDICTGGVCAGSARDCSALDDACNTGVCNEGNGACEPQPVPDGVPCDDGLFCTSGDACGGGTCVAGSPRDCSGASDDCNDGVCNEAAGSCVGNPFPDGTLCNDGLFCTVNDACQAGSCNGAPRDCSLATDPCNTGMCDDVADSCVGNPLPDGTLCDDGLFCTLNDACQAGTCTGPPMDCSAWTDACNTGVCDDFADRCESQPVADGTACEDGLFCTTGDSCSAGVCSAGPARDCGGVADQCNTALCNEAGDSCDPVPVADGTVCDDGSWCSTGDLCTSGTCSGTARDCSAAGDQCNAGFCNGATNACEQQPLADGTACDDQQFCTVGDACAAGVCGGSTRDCSSAATTCHEGVCNENSDGCEPIPSADGTPCDDGLFCTEADSCLSGSCVGGTSLDCSSAGDACNLGTCNEAADSCEPQPIADGTVCDDGLFCTDGDSCVAGTCTSGLPRDCDIDAGPCHTGVCDEDGDACIGTPVPDGTPCDDGEFCSDTDACASGVCSGGSPHDCSSADDQCNTGFCDEASDSCAKLPVADGTSCDDSDDCTSGDTCNGGVCLGSPVDADSDGYVPDTCGGMDCDDDDPALHPGAPEVCDDGIDQNCDGMDLACSCQDADGDGHPSSVCGGTDCNDRNEDVNPDALEDCEDFVDNDCDGDIDGEDESCVCVDADGDGHGDDACGGGDCDDADAGIHPGAEEVCDDDIDQDCNGADLQCGCEDVDADGYLDASCGGTDCDDSDAAVHPAAEEVCDDGIDNNCDDVTDTEDDACNPCDEDGDGHEAAACGGDDCNDVFPNIHPSAVELCTDKIDNNCDGLTDQEDAASCPDTGSSGCGCGIPGARTAIPGGLLLAAFLLLRRRRYQPQK